MAHPLKVVTPPESPGSFRRAYAALSTTRVAKAVARFVNWKLDPVLLRLTRGRFATTLVFRSAILETRGAHSGEVRRNTVIYFHDGDRVILTASHAGAPRHPGWYHNLRVGPEVTFADRPMRASVVEDPDEKRRLEDLGDRTFPGYATYRRQAAATGRTVPIVALTPVG